MSAQDEQHLYSLPLESVPMASNNYNDLQNKPSINDVSLVGNKTLAELGIVIPTKTSELENNSGFITASALPTKVSDLENDSEFTTKTYVDNAVGAVSEALSNFDGVAVVTSFFSESTFTSTFDNLATAITTAVTAIQTALDTDEFAEIKALRINTIGNVSPSRTIIIDDETIVGSIDYGWQGVSYFNNVLQAIDIVNKKILQMIMTNDTPANDAFVSYFEDSTAYTFTIEYVKYKTINLTQGGT